MTVAEQRLTLERIWLFEGCNRAELARIHKAAEEVAVPEGTLLVEEDEPGLLFFVILEGRASVVHGGRTVADLGPGEFFGELALLDDRPRSASVVAATDMALLVIRRRAFQRVLDATPALTRTLLRAMACRLRASGADADY